MACELSAAESSWRSLASCATSPLPPVATLQPLPMIDSHVSARQVQLCMHCSWLLLQRLRIENTGKRRNAFKRGWGEQVTYGKVHSAMQTSGHAASAASGSQRGAKLQVAGAMQEQQMKGKRGVAHRAQRGGR